MYAVPPCTYTALMERDADTTPKCRGCGTKVKPGYQWHPECLANYRGQVDYRRATLARDGRDCAACYGWHNRAVAAAYTFRWTHTPQWSHTKMRRWRPVEVDHVDPLALTGTHDPTNLQVLCVRHHAKKTRRDMARMKGRRPPVPKGKTLGVLLALLLAWYVAATLNANHLTPAIGVLAAASVLWLLWRRTRRNTLRRLHAAIAEVTGAAATGRAARRSLRARRWRLTSVPGLALPRLRPTRLAVRYPHTFPDHDPGKQTELENRVESKFGGTWTAKWFTTADRVVMVSPDPLVAAEGLPWPNRNATTLSMWDPIPLGVGEDGATVAACLVEKNALIGGEPGAGKSVAQSLITATAALDPDVILHGIDGKGVELAPWRDSMEDCVGWGGPTGITDATELLKELIVVMNGRYRLLIDEGRRKVERGDGLSLHVLVIDELALFTSPANGAPQKAFTEALRDVISRGRAAGIITVAATQRPAADTVPTMVRDLIGYRLALRCATPQTSDMVLGQGWASLGWSAAKVDPSFRGVGYLLAEGGVPKRLRTFWLGDGDVAALAGRAAALRAGHRGGVPAQAEPLT